MKDKDIADMEKGSEDRASNDIENPSTPLLTSLKSELESLSPLSSKRSIYRVPERLLVVNERAYTPKVVSIGPLHHGNEKLKPMEEHKKRYLSAYLKHTEKDLEHYLNIIKEKEAELRSCYAEPIDFASDDFVKIILVDATFIIEVLLRYRFAYLQDEQDPIFNKPPMVEAIMPDMLLLENQLPFFILEDLYDQERIPILFGSGEKPSIIELSYGFFRSAMYFDRTDDNSEEITSSRVEHFVDFLRNLYVPLKPKSGIESLKTKNIPTITELHRAGVEFRVKSGKDLLDIHFSNGTLEIPKLEIYDGTELTIRNLLAFEQCHSDQHYMSDYIAILDKLVNTPEDVDLLVKSKIVENHLGDSSEVATQINKLGVGVGLNSSDFYFARVFEELSDYHGTSSNKWMANLKQNYINTPWAVLSVIAAVLLIILTIIQTVCSIISTVKN